MQIREALETELNDVLSIERLAFGYEKEAYDLINRAIDLGIRYFESARAYSGSESYYGSALAERRKDIFLTSKSHARDKEGALSHLKDTLKNMKTDHLDLWQVHDVRTKEDVQAIFGPGGSIEAFIQAKEEGMTRFVGVTGHHDPSIISINPRFIASLRIHTYIHHCIRWIIGITSFTCGALC